MGRGECANPDTTPGTIIIVSRRKIHPLTPAANRNLVEILDPVGTQTEISYDGLDRQLTATVAGGAISTLAYDRRDNVTSFTDARNHLTTSTWDDFGNERTIQSPETGLTKLSYDLAGNLTSRINAKNQTIAITWDALNRPVLSRQAALNGQAKRVEKCAP